jgi:hypothetical protein
MAQKNSDTQLQNVLVQCLSDEFARLYSLWCALLAECELEFIYKKSEDSPSPSIGESLLRSAAVVEQTFGGITSNLFDDPFEWTLPETLATHESILEYLSEVEGTRRRAFDSFSSDAELAKEIVLPSGEMRSLAGLMLQTLTVAFQLYGQALSVSKILSA